MKLNSSTAFIVFVCLCVYSVFSAVLFTFKAATTFFFPLITITLTSTERKGLHLPE